jgi:cytochrome c-type biogenesis protein CcmH/NrfG
MFAEAEKMYSEVLLKDPEDFHSALRLGHIALLSNRLDDARKWLAKAAELKPEESAPKSLLAEAFYRQDDFQQAAPLLRAIGREAMATKIESLRDVSPYQTEGKAGITDQVRYD